MSTAATERSAAQLQQEARDNLWLHFTKMSTFREHQVPIIARGEGCYLEDIDGKRYLDALAGLFAVQIGYSYGDEIGEAAAAQMRELPFYTNWGYAHPRAVELAAELATLAPGTLHRSFFVSGGSEAVETAWKLARQYFTVQGERRWKVIARRYAYHGTTMGALSINGIPGLRAPWEPLVPGVSHVWNTGRYHRPPEETEEEFTRFLLDDFRQAVIQADPSSVAMVIMEPVQNQGGSFIAPHGYWAGVREICDEYGILLCADEVITGFGRLGAWFGCDLYDIRPDIITCAKGLASGYAPIGAVIAAEHIAEPFTNGEGVFTHGFTYGGHPVSCAVALKNVEIMKRERIIEHAAEKQDAFLETLKQLLELPIVGDVRGTGYFYAVELVKDKETRKTLPMDQRERLFRGYLAPTLFERGLICRTEERILPLIQIAPPLVAEQAEFDEIVRIVGETLEAAPQHLEPQAVD
jgi:adenosylmethionine-8-amino-7-oxononanoate aminotransferase